MGEQRATAAGSGVGSGGGGNSFSGVQIGRGVDRF